MAVDEPTKKARRTARARKGRVAVQEDPAVEDAVHKAVTFSLLDKRGTALIVESHEADAELLPYEIVLDLTARMRVARCRAGIVITPFMAYCAFYDLPIALEHGKVLWTSAGWMGGTAGLWRSSHVGSVLTGAAFHEQVYAWIRRVAVLGEKALFEHPKMQILVHQFLLATLAPRMRGCTVRRVNGYLDPKPEIRRVLSLEA